MPLFSPRLLPLLCALTTLTPVGVARADGTFTGLDDLPGGTFTSQAFGMSANGSVVVGTSTSASGSEAFYWTNGGGIIGLGDLPAGTFESSADGISGDGNVIIGSGRSANGREAFYWTSGTGLVGIGDLAGGSFLSRAFGVNSDGSVIVGFGTSASGSEAFRWTSGTGMVGLGDLAGGGFNSSAFGVSGDGSVVVGSGRSANHPFGEAFRWTSGTGMVGLGTISGDFFSQSGAQGISSDGSVIVGFSASASGFEAFRWTSGTGMVGIGDLVGGAFSSVANASNADGSVIVGQGTTANGIEAFRWTLAGGMQSVQDWLAAAGVPLAAGWTSLGTALGVSADGNTVVGTGTSAGGTEAFVAHVSAMSAGVITVSELGNSIAGAANPAGALNLSVSLPMDGGHHRPLMMKKNLDGAANCVWATVDGAMFRRDYDGYTHNEEVGLCRDLADDRVRVGVAVGNNKGVQKTYQGGEMALSGQYGLAEVNYNPEDTSMILGLVGLYGTWNADMERGYLNGGNRDLSHGQTDIDAASIKATVLWDRAASVQITPEQMLTFTPRASLRATRTSADAYTETGGGFPARFEARTDTSAEARIAIEAETKFNDDRTTLRGMVEGVRTLSEIATPGGNVIGLFDFASQDVQTRENWLRLGVDIGHRFENNLELEATAFTSTSGQQADLSGAISLRYPF